MLINIKKYITEKKNEFFIDGDFNRCNRAFNTRGINAAAVISKNHCEEPTINPDSI